MKTNSEIAQQAINIAHDAHMHSGFEFENIFYDFIRQTRIADLEEVKMVVYGMLKEIDGQIYTKDERNVCIFDVVESIQKLKEEIGK